MSVMGLEECGQVIDESRVFRVVHINNEHGGVIVSFHLDHCNVTQWVVLGMISPGGSSCSRRLLLLASYRVRVSIVIHD